MEVTNYSDVVFSDYQTLWYKTVMVHYKVDKKNITDTTNINSEREADYRDTISSINKTILGLQNLICFKN